MTFIGVSSTITSKIEKIEITTNFTFSYKKSQETACKTYLMVWIIKAHKLRRHNMGSVQKLQSKLKNWNVCILYLNNIACVFETDIE